MLKTKTLLLAGSALASFASGAALAQTAPETAAGGVPEIIVTATKHAESIQTVPLSISAVSSDALLQQNVHDLSRLDVLVPGLKFGQSGNDARPAIRGTRTQQVIGNADPVVAFYDDGIYRSRPGQALGTFLDVERVEVARGPQGTLFGRNSFGGAVNVISRAPKLGTFDYGGSVEVSNHAGVRAEGFVNAPLGDSAALRLSGYESRRDGWVKNIGNPSSDLHDDDNQVVRGQFRFESGDNFQNTLRVEYWHGGGNGPGDFGYYTPGVPINPTTRKTNGVNGVVDPVIAIVPGRGGGYFGLPAGTLGDSDYRTISRNLAFQRKVEQVTVSDEAQVDLNFASLKGILSYTKYSEFRLGDPDYSNVAQDAAYNKVRAQTLTEEVQLTSKAGGPLQWVLGGFFLQDRPSDLYVFGDDQSGRASTPGGLGLPGLLSTVPSANRADNLYVQGPFRSNTHSIAFYGDGTYEITSGLRVIGGVRWTQDKRKATIDNVPFAGYPPFNVDGPAYATFDKVTWRAGAQYDIAPKSMVYATYSTGFLAGGFSGAPSFVPGVSSLTTFNPTTAKAVEVGSKNTLDDGKLRLNLAGYHNEYNNLVTQKLVQVGNAISTTTANAGNIKSWGVEAEIDYYPTDAAYIGARAAYTHARFGDYVAGNSFTEGANITGVNAFQLNGLQVPLNPDFTATLIGSYDFDMGATGVLTPSATVYYTTKYRTSDQPYFFANQTSYASVDAYLRWKPSRDSKITAELFGNNLTDHRILLRTTPNAGQVVYQDFANPRIFGARISYNY